MESKVGGRTADVRVTNITKNFLRLTEEILKKDHDNFLIRKGADFFGGWITDKRIKLIVDQDRTKKPAQTFFVSFNSGHFDLSPTPFSSVDVTVTLSLEFMQQVLDNSEVYLEHPWKLDWDWIADRLSR